MGRLDERVGKLETALIKPTPQEWRLLSSLDPDFQARLAEAEEAGAHVIVMVPLSSVSTQHQHEAP